MKRLVVRSLDGSLNTLTVTEIISVDGVKWDAPPPPVELTEVVNRVTILEALIRPILDVLNPPPEPPLPPEQTKEPSDG